MDWSMVWAFGAFAWMAYKSSVGIMQELIKEDRGSSEKYPKCYIVPNKKLAKYFNLNYS